METNICQNEKNIPKKNCESSLINAEKVTESPINDFTSVIKNDSQKNHLNDTTIKKCSKCGIVKAVTEFYTFKKKNGKIATRGDCKECCIKNKKAKQYYKNPINKQRRNIRHLNRRENDIQYKISISLRSRLWSALKGNYKNGSAVKDLGCSIDELKIYLESKFTNGMNWDNYGEWHIDHKRPLASFDLTDRQQLLEACHYTNLQPLWAEDNLSKSDKIL